MLQNGYLGFHFTNQLSTPTGRGEPGGGGQGSVSLQNILKFKIFYYLNYKII